MVSMAGASWSFAEASERLKELCGIEVSAELLRQITEATGDALAKWLHTEAAAGDEFATASGDGRVSDGCDGDCVQCIEMAYAMVTRR